MAPSVPGNDREKEHIQEMCYIVCGIDAVRGVYATASEMAVAVSRVCLQVQPPHNHTHPPCATRINPVTGWMNGQEEMAT